MIDIATNVRVLAEAADFVTLLEKETDRDMRDRLAEIEAEVRRTGTYRQTFEELEYGAKVAWRNNTHCIGRLHWRTLQVRDLRHLDDPEDVFQACVEHVRLATNGGRIRPLITVFAPRQPGQEGWRIWNPQLIRYAGHRQPDGSVVGDPLHADLTDALRALGWKGGRGDRFDVLPLAIQAPGQAPRLFELPADAVLEVPISHPTLPWFEELGLRWHALPAISDMSLDVGGVVYPAAPFNGWYVATEIGARNLSDVSRYDVLPEIGRRMGLDTRSDRSLWKDRAIVELNVAVMHSFIERKVTMVDHHTVCRQFVSHEKQETEAGRAVPAEWSWLTPPISGSTTPVFHRFYPGGREWESGILPHALKPNFFYQPQTWRVPKSHEEVLQRVFTGACPVSSEELRDPAGACLGMDPTAPARRTA